MSVLWQNDGRYGFHWKVVKCQLCGKLDSKIRLSWDGAQSMVQMGVEPATSTQIVTSLLFVLYCTIIEFC